MQNVARFALMNTKEKIALAVFAGIAGLVALDSFLRTKPAKLYVVDWLPYGYNAMTVPPVGVFVLKEHQNNLALLTHENVHWSQYQRMGVLKFYYQYAHEKSRHGYDRMPMEIEARVNESDHCKHHYTECVRNGTAATVSSSNFRS